MRVLHFYKTSLPQTVGGVEQVIDQIARGTHKLGVTTEVLSLSAEWVPRTIEVNGYVVHREKLGFEIASTGFSASVFSRFSQLAKHADVIHYHYPWPFMDMVHLVSRVKKPAVVTYHSDVIRQKKLGYLYRPLMRKFLSGVHKIVATSPNYLASSDVLGKYKDKIHVIPIGLDKTSYPVPPEKRLAFWRDKIGPKFFLFVGVLRYYKGLHILLDAARGTPYPIVIVGAGPIEEDLKRQAREQKLSTIHFLGQLSDEDKVALLKQCTGVLFPSHLRSEAFGVSLLEGAMYGKPMISSEIGTGTSFINVGGETGLVIPPSDPDALRHAMQYMWEHPSVATEMGKRAQERYWGQFTADKMAHAYVDLYRELLAV